jgi:hypothetical protein
MGRERDWKLGVEDEVGGIGWKKEGDEVFGTEN